MARHVRVPLLADMVLTGDPAEIRLLLTDPRADRTFAVRGPLLNRLIMRRIRRVLVLDGAPLPPVAPRAAPGRAGAQAALEQRLRALAEPCSPQQRDELVAHVLGHRDPAALAPLVQSVVGCLFAPGYEPRPERWEAARLIDAAVRSNNVLRRLGWALTRRVSRARAFLSEPVRNDRAGLHATAVAVHNLVASFETMRVLLSQPWSASSMTTESAVARCLSPPSAVLRQWNAHAATAAAELRPGTLVVADLHSAHESEPSGAIAFMRGTWAQCPAAAWVESLLAAVWEQAVSTLPGRGATT
jgi:hypothetical protein